MKAFSGNIEKQTLRNTSYRRVIYTGSAQLVLMSLKPREEIGFERHHRLDQFFRFERGTGVVIIDGKRHRVGNGSAIMVPSGVLHNVRNTSKTTALKFYTVYSHPTHRARLVQKEKRR